MNSKTDTPSVTRVDSLPSPAIADEMGARAHPASSWRIFILRWFIAVTLLPVLVLTSVRVVASKPFLELEYNRPGFPADRYGFSTDERLDYAPYALEYMRNDADISYLGNLTFDDGSALYTAEELRHMEDVKAVSRVAFTLHKILVAAFGGAILFMAWNPGRRRALRAGLRDGGVLVLAAIGALVFVILASWDTFFDTFHGLFFESGTWRFSTSDTLIRLFPEQFWFDVANTIGMLTISGALAAIWIGWYGERRAARQPKENGASQGPVRVADR